MKVQRIATEDTETTRNVELEVRQPIDRNVRTPDGRHLELVAVDKLSVDAKNDSKIGSLQLLPRGQKVVL